MTRSVRARITGIEHKESVPCSNSSQNVLLELDVGMKRYRAIMYAC